MITHTITIAPSSIGERGQRYRVTFAGRVLLEGAREPLLDAARALAAQGITGRLEMWRPGKATHDMAADIERAARFTVAEASDIGPEFRAWRPFAREGEQHAFPVVTGRPRKGAAEFPVARGPAHQSAAGELCRKLRPARDRLESAVIHRERLKPCRA